MRRSDYDIVIVGGGLVGASLALALQPLGYTIAVLEAVSPRATDQPSYDDRTLALGQASCHILQGLGLWPELQDRATAIREVIVRELQRPGEVTLSANELGLEAFGYVVEAREFGRAVMHEVTGKDGIDMLCPARATGLQQGEDQVDITVMLDEKPASLSARLVVAADGAQSTVRDMLGITFSSKQYDQAAIIANVTPIQHHNGRAWEFLTPTGPFALLPHVGERCGLVWCVAAEQQQSMLDMPEEEFLRAACERSGGVLGDFVKLGQRSAYPLQQIVPERDTDKRVLLLGNAAHAIHPVGAQGFNLGLRDVAVLAQIFADAAIETGEIPDPGADEWLQHYSRWRRPDQRSTVAWTDDMASLFSSELAVTRSLRSAALLMLSVMPSARRRMASRAMGYRGRVPRMALGEPLLRHWPGDS